MTTAIAPERATKRDAKPEEAEGNGPLLDEDDEKKVAKMVAKIDAALDEPMARRVPKWEMQRLSRKGIRGVRIDTSEAARDDRDGVWVPPGAVDAMPAPNNVDRLVRRIVDTLTSDPPVLEGRPPSRDDQDVEASELASRVLEQDDSDAGANLRTRLQRTLNLAGTYCSAFSYLYVDPCGVREPLELLAHPNAIDADSPTVDPATGEAPASKADYVKRFVKKGGPGEPARVLVQSPVDAEHVWKPCIREETLRPHCVKLLPATAEGIADATGIIVGRVTTLGALKGQYPAIGEWKPDDLRKLCAWRPKVGARHWVPLHLAKAAEEAANAMKGEKSDTPNDTPPDETPVFVRCLFYKSQRDYPRGAFVCIGADDQLIGRGVWAATVGDANDAREVIYDLPVAQLRWFDDPNDGDPYGISPVEWLAPLDEVIAMQVVAWMEYLFRFNNPNVYLPLGSPIQPGALATRDGTPIRYDAATGKPEYEAIPAFPKESPELMDRFEATMNTISGLENAARGVADPSVKSGVHAEQIIERALVALTQVVQNATDYMTRRGRIKLQLIATNYTAPRLLSYQSEGGAYRVRSFQGADLRTVKDVQLAKNSMTMLPRTVKLDIARQQLEIGLNAGDPSAYLKYRTASANLVDPIIGEQDDPHLMRVQRQIAAWRDGPSMEAQAEARATPPAPPQLDESGQPMPAPMGPEMTKALESLAKSWAPLPVDTDPIVAPMRAFQLGRAMSSERFERFAPAWNQPLAAAYQAAREAIGQKNIPEQQADAQGQAEGAEQGAQTAHARELETIQVKAQSDAAARVQVEEARGAIRAEFPVQTSANAGALDATS